MSQPVVEGKEPVQLTHPLTALWTVPGLRRKLQDADLRSPWFNISGSDFQLFLRAKEKSWISAYLCSRPKPSGVWPAAAFTLRATNTRTGQVHKRGAAHSWTTQDSDWGFTQLARDAEFELYDDVQLRVSFTALQLGCSDPLQLSPARGAVSMSHFYNSQELSDCTVVAEQDGRTFAAHKFALCAAWPVFRAMLVSSSSMAEAASSQVVMREVPGEVVEVLLQLIYVCPTQLRVELAVQAFQLAEQYQADPVKQLIAEALQHTSVQLYPDALAVLLSQARMLGAAALQLTAYLTQQACSRLKQLRQQPAFLQSWQLEDVLALLQDAAAADRPALQLLLLADEWVQADMSSRLQHWPSLMAHVSLDQLHVRHVLALDQRHPAVLQLPTLSLKLLRQFAVAHAEDDTDTADDDEDSP